MSDELTHLDSKGRAQMVDVSSKSSTYRRAVARGFVFMAGSTLQAIRSGGLAKGEVLQVARIAGIMAAKRTPELIPLCHGLPLDQVAIEFFEADTAGEHAIGIEATAICSAKTGVEMEAMTAVSVAALTIYDMAKAVDKAMHIGAVHLVQKEGGKSGTFNHPSPPGPQREGERGDL